MIANTAAYHFTPIADPDALCATLLERATAGGLRGTILVAGEGITCSWPAPTPALPISTLPCMPTRALPGCG